MSYKTRPQDATAYSAVITIILFSIANSTFNINSINYNSYVILLIMFSFLMYFYALFNFKYFWISIFLILGLAYRYGFIKSAFIILSGVYDFIQNLYSNQYVTSEYSGYFIKLMIILLCLVALLFYYFVIVKRKPYTIIAFGCTIFAIYYFMTDYNLLNDCEIFLISSLFLIAFDNLVSTREEINSRNIKIDRKYGSRWLLYLSLFLVIVAFLTSFMPYSHEPIKFKWVERNIIDRFRGKEWENSPFSSGKGQFSLSSTGYQPNPARLGGAIRLKRVPALKLESDRDIRSLHLRGSIKDYYNGYLWLKTDTVKKPEDIKQIENRYIATEALKLQIFNYNNTTTIFNVLYPEKIEIDSGQYYVDNYNEISTLKATKRTYVSTSLMPKLNKNVLLKAGNSSVNRKDMENYLKIPAQMPDRVYDLTHSITDQYSNYYMKASAIESYLKKNYPYSLNASNLPQGKDFVDYFLFEEKKGYCTYYSTAMAVMARIAGIPSRYVEGYSIDSYRDKGGVTMVYESDAHAWVELYFRDIGWVTFDPTPGRSSNSMIIESKIMGDENKNEEEIQKKEITKPEMPPQESKQGNIEEKNKDISVWIWVLILIGAFSLILYAFLRLIKKEVNLNRLMRKSIKSIILYGRINGVNYTASKTIREYIQELNRSINYSGEDISDYFDAYLYGHLIPSKSDVNKIREYVYFLNKASKERSGRIKMYIKYLYYDLRYSYLKNNIKIWTKK